MSIIEHPDNFSRTIPEGDDHERLVCTDCGFIAYENPKLIAGAVVLCGDKILLCKRAIEPEIGSWTIPAGYMEVGESPAEGAARETWEEAQARVIIDDLLAVYTVKHTGQIQMMYRARLQEPDFAPGIESLEVALFAWDDIPWDDIAFPSVRWALEHYKEVMGQKTIVPFTNPVEFKNG